MPMQSRFRHYSFGQTRGAARDTSPKTVMRRQDRGSAAAFEYGHHHGFAAAIHERAGDVHSGAGRVADARL